MNICVRAIQRPQEDGEEGRDRVVGDGGGGANHIRANLSVGACVALNIYEERAQKKRSAVAAPDQMWMSNTGKVR